MAMLLWLAPSAALAADHPKEARSLAVATPGGPMQDALQRAFFTPFAAQTHIAVRLAAAEVTLDSLQNHPHPGADAERDLVLMQESSVRVACAQGLLLPIDAALDMATAPSDARQAGAAARCGQDGFRTGLVLAWDRSRIDSPPGWSDFWDVARRPGKRGLARDPRGTLEIALLADGVPAGDVYRTLNSAAGVDRAFRKLDQLKPYIVWWDTPAQAMRIIESGAVLMTSAPGGDVAAADLIGHRDFAVQWQQAISRVLSWAVPSRPATPGAPPAIVARSPRLDAAGTLLAFMDDPSRQAAFLALYPAAGVLPETPATGDDGSDAAPDAIRAALPEDDAFWFNHLDALRSRFNTWIAAASAPGGGR